VCAEDGAKRENAVIVELKQWEKCVMAEGENEVMTYVGGGERETNLDFLVSQINTHKLPMKAFEWYLDLRKYGSVPHGGFGFGLERIVAWVCGLDHVRETIPFPRTIYRLRP
jgi:asparaginyl-tRNA synthetase